MKKLFALLAVCGFAGLMGCSAEVDTTVDETVIPSPEEMTGTMEAAVEETTTEEPAVEETTAEEATSEEATSEEATSEETATEEAAP